MIKMNVQEIEQEWISKYDITTGRLKQDLSKECYEWASCNNKRTDELSKLMVISSLRSLYENIISYLKKWVDIPEEQMKIIAIWIIGTYFHKEFNAYPYLFFNAMRGSGKTRLLTIVSHLVKNGNGELLNNPSEPVIFRTAKERALIFDEFESQKSKEKQALREYLNGCYKVGGVVHRMEKVKVDGKEVLEAKGHQLYTPIAIANINGIDDILQDRSITLVLEKSMNPYLVKKIENFNDSVHIKTLKMALYGLSVQLCSVYPLKNVQEGWNRYVEEKYTSQSIHTLHTLHTIQNYTELYTQLDEEEMFNKIDKTGIFGRNLELFFPLLLIGKILGNDVFDELLLITSKLNASKKETEYAESKDVSLIEFIAQRDNDIITYVYVSELFNEFMLFSGSSKDRDSDVNITWFGSALRRLKLLTQVKRDSRGKKVLLDIIHAKEKLKVFRCDEEIQVKGGTN